MIKSDLPGPLTAWKRVAGQNGKLSNMITGLCLIAPMLSRSRSTPKHDEQHKPPRSTAWSPPRRTATVRLMMAPYFPVRGIVVIAVQQHLIDDVADLVLRGLDQSQPQIFRRKFHAIEVLRDASLRRQHHNGGGVRELSESLSY